MKNLDLFPENRLPLFAELGMFLFPLAPGLGAIALGIQLIRSTKHLGKQIIKQPIARILGGISLWLFFVTAMSPYRLDSLLGMANFLPFFLFFLVFSQLLNTVDKLARMAWLFVIPSSVVALLGLGDIWFHWQTPGFIWTLLGWDLTGVGNPAGRVASTFLYANLCAAYLLMTFLLGLGLWLKDFSWQRLTQSKLLIYLTFTLAIDFVALVFTNSRNVWAIACLGILVYAFYIGWWWICAFAGGFVMAVLGASFGRSPWRDSLRQIVPYYLWGRLSDQMYAGDRPTADLRLTQWQFVLDMIHQRPLTGFGLRSFTPAYETAMDTWLGHPHNLYLMLTFEMGIPAAGLLIGLIGWVLAKGTLAWRALSEPSTKLVLFSYLVAFGGYSLFNLLDVTALDLRLNTFAWLLLAGIWGLGQQVNQTGNQGQPHGSPEEN